MIEGACLCGEIQYKYNGTINELVICHCNQCKRAQGTVFAANAPLDADLFEITMGQALLQVYFSSPKKQRLFCSNCGSPIFSKHADKPAIIRLRVGTITSGLERIPDYQQFCESKPEWLELNLNIPVYRRSKK